jgi:hypothetical protein
MTDTTSTTEQSRTDGQTRQFSQTMGEMDHTPPVGGPRRTFERNNEGRPVTDGGRPTDGRSGDDETEGEDAGVDEAETEAKPDGGNQFTQKMKEMDHTPPVDGANRTFERGGQSDDVSE